MTSTPSTGCAQNAGWVLQGEPPVHVHLLLWGTYDDATTLRQPLPRSLYSRNVRCISLLARSVSAAATSGSAVRFVTSGSQTNS